MRHHLKCLIVLLFCSMLMACGVTERLAQQPSSRTSETNNHNQPQRTAEAAPSPEKDSTSMPLAIHASNYSEVQSTLRQAYHKWKNTPYQWGGTTIHGVDCSAFMQLLFNHYFEVEIPRTTEQQIYAGHKVSRKHLQPGDLIFFKTGRKTLHVGVVVEMPKFMHASTSQGVTISSLKDYYWRSRYLTAKRVLN